MITEQKAEIRTRLKQIRAAIPQKDRQKYSQIITSRIRDLEVIRRSQHIFIYISCDGEVETHDLINKLLKQGKTLAVPKIIDSDHMVAVAFTDWSELETGQLGILTPKSCEPAADNFDVVITPGLGFTTDGYRIGYGRGYYDKWFAKHQVQQKIAMTFDEQVIETLPITDFDIPVNMIVTESRIIQVPATSRSK